MIKYFNIDNIKTAEDLKKQYRKLAQQFHPDAGGDAEIMKIVNNEYEVLFSQYKDIHADFKDETKTYKATKGTSEAPQDFINIINELLKMDGLNVELCGRWLWISGETMKHKDNLKKYGCKWSSAKKMWSWHFQEDGSTYRKKGSTMSDIRSKYGSEFFKKSDDKKQIAG